MKPILVALGLALTNMMLGSLAVAQVNPMFSELSAATEDARSIVQTERKTLVSQGLKLTVDEGVAFWPVYERYVADMKSAGDLRVKVITDYAANYDDLTEESARQLIANSLKYQEKLLDIRKDYLRKFRKALPEVKLARFYQIENKLDAIMNFVLAREIPLIPSEPSSRPIAPPVRQ